MCRDRYPYSLLEKKLFKYTGCLERMVVINRTRKTESKEIKYSLKRFGNVFGFQATDSQM